MAIFKKVKVDDAASPQPLHTVLLVDDEPDNLSVLSAILGNRYHIMRAADGQEALELVEQMPNPAQLTLVVSDQRMPRLTGAQLAERLRAISPDTMCIIVSGYIDVDAIVDSINRAQIYQFVLKPFDREDFEQTVQRAVQAYEMKRKREDYVRELERRAGAQSEELDQLHEAQAKLELLGMTDLVTGLHNRHYLQAVLAQDGNPPAFGHLQISAPDQDHTLVYFLIDSDQLKQVNQQYGEEVGDQLLRAMADALQPLLRTADHLLRWVSGEFLAMVRFHSRHEAEEIAELLRHVLSQVEVPLAGGQCLRRTVSIGYAVQTVGKQHPTLDYKRMIKLAQFALSCAKHSGRNIWVGLTVGAQAESILSTLQHINEVPTLLALGRLSVTAPCEASGLRWI